MCRDIDNSEPDFALAVEVPELDGVVLVGDLVGVLPGVTVAGFGRPLYCARIMIAACSATPYVGAIN